MHLYGHKKQYGSAPRYNLWLPQPDEAYEFWNAYAGVPFSQDTLHQRICDPADRAALREAVHRVVFWQGRSRFAAKLTGPPRIGFLHSVFPDARFVHLVRDGRDEQKQPGDSRDAQQDDDEKAAFECALPACRIAPGLLSEHNQIA